MANIHACQNESTPAEQPAQVIRLDPAQAADISQKIKTTSTAQVPDGLEISLWASDSLVNDPIAISVDPQGRIFYTRANRRANSEFDVRWNRHWMTAFMSFQTVEDRRKFLRENFTAVSAAGHPVKWAGTRHRLFAPQIPFSFHR